MKEFNEYIETNQWLKTLMDKLNEEDGMRLEDAFYAFKKHCTKADNLPISDVKDRLNDFLSKQQDIPDEVQKVINEKFWDLI